MCCVLQSKEEKDDEEELCTTIKANPMPDFSKSHFKPSLPHKKTEVKPFSFETRYQDKLTRKSLVESILEKDKQKEAEVHYYAKYKGQGDDWLVIGV